MRVLSYGAAIGGMWFLGLMHGYTAGNNLFPPHAETICMCIEIALVAILALSLSSLEGRRAANRPEIVQADQETRTNIGDSGAEGGT